MQSVMRASRQVLLVLGLGFAVSAAFAQMTPVGKWHTIDDETGEVKSLIAITEANGAATGRIEALLRKGADQAAKCTACTDARKDQPMLGLEIIRGAKKAAGEPVWEGEILDPEKGKTYKLKMTPIEGGAKLQVRGYLGFFYRTQVWVRVN